MDAKVTYREPKNGQYILELQLSGCSSETILICPAQSGSASPRMESVYAQACRVLKGGLDFFAEAPLPAMHVDDKVYGLAKVLEYIRDNVADGTLLRISGNAMTQDLRKCLLDCDELLKHYRKEDSGPVFGHQAELQEARPVSLVEKASLERLCVKKF